MSGGARTVLVTGGRGYLGSVLVPQLLAAGKQVVCYDRPPEAAAAELPGVTRLLGDGPVPPAAVLGRVDAVVALAAIGNDPASAVSGVRERAVNVDAVVRLGRAARAQGVRCLVFPSSCSVYGVTQALADESAPPAPLTGYARDKVEAEAQLAALARADFQVVVLRLATLFGPSPRQRLDLLLNALVHTAVREGLVRVPRPPQRRPLLHVRDAAEAVRSCVDPLPQLARPGRAATWNVVGCNVTTTGLALAVADRLRVRAEPAGTGADLRSYWASGRRFEAAFRTGPWRGTEQGIDELAAHYRAEASVGAEAAAGTGPPSAAPRPHELRVRPQYTDTTRRTRNDPGDTPARATRRPRAQP